MKIAEIVLRLNSVTHERNEIRHDKGRKEVQGGFRGYFDRPSLLGQIETTHILTRESAPYRFILLGIPPRSQKGKSDLDAHILIGHWLVPDHTEQGERVNLI